MSCLSNITLKGISLDCNAILGGIRRAWLGYDGDFTVTVDETTHTVTTFAASTASASPKLYQYDFAKESGSLNSEMTKDEATGVRYYTNTLTLSFNKLEGAKHIEVEAMAAEALIGLVEDNNGKIWVLGTVISDGKNEGGYLSASATSATAGQSYGDKSGYDVTMTQMSSHLPYEIELDDFDSFISK